MPSATTKRDTFVGYLHPPCIQWESTNIECNAFVWDVKISSIKAADGSSRSMCPAEDHDNVEMNELVKTIDQ